MDFLHACLVVDVSEREDNKQNVLPVGHVGVELVMDVFECIAARRSVRDYDARRIPRDVVEKILDAAVCAPSAMHVLPWKFIIMEDQEKLKDLDARVKKAYGLLGKAISVAFLKGKTVFHNAPLVILIVCEKSGQWFREDSALAAENAFLAARALGVGSCFIGMAHRLNDKEEDLQAAGVPKGHRIFAALAFGYPRGEWPKGEKRSPKIVSWT